MSAIQAGFFSSLQYNRVPYIPKSAEFGASWKAGTSDLPARVCLVVSLFVDEKFLNDICASFLILPKVFWHISLPPGFLS